MEEKKKQVSARLGTVIIIVVLLIITLAVAIVILNKKTNDDNTILGNNLVQKANNSDLIMNFLKLENGKKNMIYSPLSIKYALSMLNEGADGKTKEQIEKVLGNTNLVKYENQDKVLSLANSIYIRDNYKQNIKEEYKNALVQKYQAEIQYDSFKNAKNVNQWVEQKTLGIIKNMIRDEVVQDPYMQMLLVNALAIDMEWKSQFKQSDTQGENFYLTDGNIMQATMMNKETTSDAIAYYKNRDITALTIELKKYDDIQLEFVAIMPNDNQLSEYVNKINVEEIQKIVDRSINASKIKGGVRVKIPKFSYNYDLKLKEDLKKLGITDAFDSKLADLSKITDTDLRLFVGNALHKADIQFTEKGVKAAAVTTLLVKDTMAIEEQERPEEITIDKPFLYIIRDKQTNEVWFVGTVYEPNSWEKDKMEYEKSQS